MSPEPVLPAPPPPAVLHTAWALAAGVGGVAGVLTNRMVTGASHNGVGMMTLLYTPFLFGVLGGLLQPLRPMRTALLLSVICLVVATPLLGEGIACLMIVLPWHLVISPGVAGIVGFVTRRLLRARRAKAAMLVLAFAGNAAAPAVDARLADPDARETFADQVVVDAPQEAVWRSIERLHMDFSTPAPWIVRAALPRPVGIRGGGAGVGDERRVLFDNGVVLATVTASDPPRSFDIDLKVVQSGPEFFDHWAVLERSRFVLDTLPDGRTAITHVTTYRPLAFPRWYFAPVERLLGKLVQRHMLEAYAAEVFPTEAAPMASLP